MKHNEPSSNGNDATEFFGLAPLIWTPGSVSLTQIEVQKIELPVGFLRQHNQKGFINIRVL